MSKSLSYKNLARLAVCKAKLRLLIRFVPEHVALKIGMPPFGVRGQGSIVAYLPAIALLYQIQGSTRLFRLGELGRGLVELFALASHKYSVYANP